METKKTRFKTNFFLGIFLFIFCVSFFSAPVMGNPFEQQEQHYIYLQLNNPFLTVDGVTMLIDPTNEATPLWMEEWSRILVPLRGIIENMKATLSWNAETKEITLRKDSLEKTVLLQINNPKATINLQSSWIDEENHQITPCIIKERTYLPVLFIATVLNAKVEWSGDHNFISITWTENKI